MNNISKIIMSATLAFIMQISSTQATVINGDISISGGFVPVSENGLQDATAIDFLEWNGSEYVSGTTGGSFTVASASGDFSSFVTPSPFILGNINDFSFAPFSAVAPLWEIGGFSFDLLSIAITEQTATKLILTGTGEVYGNDFERTEGSWLMTANGGNTTFSWSATTNVPEPSTILLMSLGMLGLVGHRRKRT